MTHVMIDLETLDTASTAVILQIGAQAFSRSDGLIGDGLAVQVDPQSCLDVGMTVSWATIHWWLTGGWGAADTLPKPGEGLHLSQALSALGQYISSFNGEETVVWARGPGFDISILEVAHRACGAGLPWRFYNVRCVRTLTEMCPQVRRVEAEVKHNALSDARAQAQHVLECWRSMGATDGEEVGSSPLAAAEPTVAGQEAFDNLRELRELRKLYDELQRFDWGYRMGSNERFFRGDREMIKLTTRAHLLKGGPELLRAVSNYQAGVGPEVSRP